MDMLLDMDYIGIILVQGLAFLSNATYGKNLVFSIGALYSFLSALVVIWVVASSFAALGDGNGGADSTHGFAILLPLLPVSGSICGYASMTVDGMHPLWRRAALIGFAINSLIVALLVMAIIMFLLGKLRRG